MPTRVDIELSLVVCTYNRPKTLALLLAALKDQIAGAPVELIVVDSASRSDLAAKVRELVARIPGAHALRADEPGVSRARNMGLQHARAPWIAFLDDDELPTPDWLASARALIRRLPDNCAACGGNVRPIYPEGSHPEIGPRWAAYLSTILRPGEFDQTADLQFGVGHSLVRARALEEVGGFDHRLGRDGGSLLSGEEVLLVQQLIDAGWRIWHSDRIEVGHLIEAERLTHGWVRRRAYWEGVTRARLLSIHDRKALHGLAVKVAVKAGPLGIAALLAPRLRELHLRFAFASGFLAAYTRQLSAKPLWSAASAITIAAVLLSLAGE